MVKEAFPDPSVTELSAESSPSELMPGSIAPVDPLLCQPCWEVPEPPTDLIFDDGEPLESNRHRIAMNVLYRFDRASIYCSHRTRSIAPQRLLCRRQYVCLLQPRAAQESRFSRTRFFLVLDIEGDRERQGWVVWEENGRYPDVIVELMSPSTA